MSQSTADRVLQALGPFGLKQEGPGRYRCNSPLRPGSNSHSFTLRINGPEHGAFYDHVSGVSGSLYTLAAILGVQNAPVIGQKRRMVVAYDYVDEQGQLLYQSCRYEPGKNGKPKDFVQRRPDGKGGWLWDMKGARYVLYHLPAVLQAVAAGETVYIVEGEKDADRLELCGLAATCNVAGANNWRPDYAQSLHGADVVILPDNDQPGAQHATAVASALVGMATRVRVVDLPGLAVSGDISDWLDAGHTLTELQALVAAAPPVQPPNPPAPATATPPGPAPRQPLNGPTARLAAALLAEGYRCAYNVETGEITVNGDALDDRVEKLMRAEVRDRNLGPVGILGDAIALQAEQHKYAPIRDGLAALQWNGQRNIAQLANHLHTSPDDVISYADGSTRRAAEVFLEKFLIAAVARIFHGEQNAMLVLDGPQNLGKSSLAKWLGSVLPGVFCEETPNPADKDSLLRLTKTLIWEAGELDATTRRHDASAFKHFLTRSTVTARRAYARHDTTRPVLASFIGTVNSAGNGFLPDPTGNRRYLVLSLTRIDWAYQQLDVTQVWAEAVARCLAGERGQLAPEEAAYRDQINTEQHQVTGLMDDWLSRYFEVTHDPDDLLTSGEIAEHLASKEIRLSGGDRAQAMAIAEALTRVGVTRADRKVSQKRYGDHRRAWQGIAVRITGQSSGQAPAPHSVPAVNQPQPVNQPQTNLGLQVGSAHQNGLSPFSKPTLPTSEEEKDQTSLPEAATAAPGATSEESLPEVGKVGSVGSQEPATATERGEPTSDPDRARLVQVTEVGLAEQPPGARHINDLAAAVESKGPGESSLDELRRQRGKAA